MVDPGVASDVNTKARSFVCLLIATHAQLIPVSSVYNLHAPRPPRLPTVGHDSQTRRAWGPRGRSLSLPCRSLSLSGRGSTKSDGRVSGCARLVWVSRAPSKTWRGSARGCWWQLDKMNSKNTCPRTQALFGSSWLHDQRSTDLARCPPKLERSQDAPSTGPAPQPIPISSFGRGCSQLRQLLRPSVRVWS